ncbi:metallophosphoesterase [Sphingobacterium faecale]|uniref:Metallophosphoesterase n=1 Tax=Sphingobacterium faecale TaxID=2803775 RepID=A0ABS1R0P7_9SPHI|nr:metallophosphoesterase [Sphingobacterium faecale]MBL1408267.1 metallophosphoesterase [Sphingobacterium faecale]
MFYLKILSLQLLWGICGFTFVVAQNSTSNTYTIVHMTDPQLGFHNNDNLEAEILNFERAIRATNRLKPSAVFISGDLVNRIHDSVQIAAYKDVVRMLNVDIPLYVMPGNHDLPDGLTLDDLKKYQNNFGRDYYDVKLKSTYVLVLNSQMIASSKNVTEAYLAQFNWMQRKLKQAKRKGYKHILVFQHHPYFVDSLEEKDEYFNIPIQVRKKYLDLFQQKGVGYIFTGHLHYNLINQYNTMELVTTGPISRAFKQQESGVRLIRIDDKKLTHHYYSLDEYENLF